MIIFYYYKTFLNMITQILSNRICFKSNLHY